MTTPKECKGKKGFNLKVCKKSLDWKKRNLKPGDPYTKKLKKDPLFLESEINGAWRNAQLDKQEALIRLNKEIGNPPGTTKAWGGIYV